ncbi:terminase small subunit [Dyadobacter endophyticus]|uniref:terminase small subunit n=1 Tax=Dyadobacter endophyticus TaxID=1749036 RepID=UPI003CF7CE19
MEDQLPPEASPEEKGLTNKQVQFCREYLVDFNGAQAAIRAGYAVKSARVMACNMLKLPKVDTYLKQLLRDAELGPEETAKLISDIARSSLNDYFTTRTVEFTPKIRKPVADLIKELEAVIEFEDDYVLEAELTDEELTIHAAQQSLRQKTLVRYRLVLKRNPKATEIVDGPTELKEVPELDMAKLVADKERGKIKSITPGQFGTKVEMYSADTALTNLARIHGLFAAEKVDANVKATVHVAISKEDVELFRDVFNSKY